MTPQGLKMVCAGLPKIWQITHKPSFLLPASRHCFRCLILRVWSPPPFPLGENIDRCIFKLVTCHFVPRSFRTQVISYRFGHFVPTFIFNLVISYLVWPFRTHFVPSLVISYLLLQFSRKQFWSFRTYFYCFVRKSFRTQVISYPLPN